MYTIPSFDPSSEKRDATAIPTNLRDSLSCLDVVWSDMFENGDSVNDSEVATTDFLKGAPAQWMHFNTSEISPFVERDGFGKLIQLIERKKGKSCLITEVSLQYEPGSGGSTLAMQVLWHFRKDLRCARVIDVDAKKLPKQVVDLFLLSNEQHAKHDQKTVLLLLDTKENNDQPIKNTLCKNLIDEIKTRYIETDTPAVIILNCITANFPTKDRVEIKMMLSPTEKKRFDQKRQELEKKYKEKSQNFHAFNIMQGGFKKEDAEKVITAEMVEHVKNNPQSKSTRLLSFLALINSYAPGSHLSRLLCEEFIAKTDRSSDEENTPLQTTMKPFMDLLVVFSEGKPEKNDYIRMAHPMIADACVNMLTEHKLTRFSIAYDFLKSMVKGKERNYMQICKRLLTNRLDAEKYSFSKLILDLKYGIMEQCIDLLKLASDLFDKDPFYPQALARLNYIKVKETNKFDEAKRWAKIAIERDENNSHIRDTLGRVHKNHLLNIKSQTETLSSTETLLNIAKSAIKAFQDEEKAAEKESEHNTSFNNRGYFGFLQVCKIIYDVPKKPLEQNWSKFISDLKGDVEDRYDFFEWYLAFSRPRINKKDPDYLHNHIEECYKQYFMKENQTDEATLNEKKMKSFGGLLHFLKSDVSVLKQTFKNPQSDDETQNVLYVLANILMFDRPSERAEELQASLHKLWVSKKQDRSPEFYLLILLLFWFDEAQPRIPNPPDLEECVKYMAKSYEKKYRKYLRGRYLVPLFFFREGSGLVHISKLHQNDDVGDLELLLEGDEVSCLQRISGEVKKDLKVFAMRDGKQIQVTPNKRDSVCKQGKVSFYLGFSIRGPVAFNIRYSDTSSGIITRTLNHLHLQ